MRSSFLLGRFYRLFASLVPVPDIDSSRRSSYVARSEEDRSPLLYAYSNAISISDSDRTANAPPSVFC